MLIAVALASPSPAAAQVLSGSGGLTAGSLRARSRVGTSDNSSSGMVIGGEGRARLGRVTVDVVYFEGTLDPDTGSAESRDYVEGGLYLSVVTVPGVTLRTGPHARTYVSSSGRQRWLFWTARVRGERALIAPTVTGFVELWAALSGSVNVSEPFTAGKGGAVGMTVQIPRSPLWSRLSYGIEHTRMGEGARLETVEGVSVMLGIGRR